MVDVQTIVQNLINNVKKENIEEVFKNYYLLKQNNYSLRISNKENNPLNKVHNKKLINSNTSDTIINTNKQLKKLNVNNKQFNERPQISLIGDYECNNFSLFNDTDIEVDSAIELSKLKFTSNLFDNKNNYSEQFSLINTLSYNNALPSIDSDDELFEKPMSNKSNYLKAYKDFNRNLLDSEIILDMDLFNPNLIK